MSPPLPNLRAFHFLYFFPKQLKLLANGAAEARSMLELGSPSMASRGEFLPYFSGQRAELALEGLFTPSSTMSPLQEAKLPPPLCCFY